MSQPPDVTRLRIIKSQLLAALKEVDLALSQAGGGDLVSWAGTARDEQRCNRCSYWIFTDDKIAAVVIDTDRSVYVHRRCVVRPAATEKDDERGGG